MKPLKTKTFTTAGSQESSSLEGEHPFKEILAHYATSPSFKLNSTGVLFDKGRRRLEVGYNQIEWVEDDGAFLKFYLNDNTYIYSSLISDFYLLEYANSGINN